MNDTAIIDQRLPKSERLHLQRDINRLFQEGHSLISYPLRVVYHLSPMLEDNAPNSQILVSISKKYFKRANKRNRVKRLIREAYRTNKQEWVNLLQLRQQTIDIAFMTVSKDLPDYETIRNAVLKALRKIAQKEQLSSDEELDTNQPQPGLSNE